MFDAKSILDALMKGAGPQPQPQSPPSGGGSMGGLGDILSKLQQAGAGAAQGGGGGGGGLGDILSKLGQAGGAGGGGLEDMLRKMLPSGGAGQTGPAHTAGGSTTGAAHADTGGGLADILAKLQRGAGGVTGTGIADVLGQLLGQATEGVKEGAGRVSQATGARGKFSQATGGQTPEDILAKLEELVAQNQLGAGAALGGLGAAVLGTKTGRSMAASAVKLGGLALIGGLAYKAFQNYQDGKPLIMGRVPVTQAAPQGSGFEPQAVTQNTAALYLRAMIAAAAADGRVDDAEQEKIMGGLKQAGLDAEAEQFLANELNNPATADDLAAACETPEQAVQVYTAARVAIEPNGDAEKEFLATLADKLGVDAGLAAQIDAAARSAA